MSKNKSLSLVAPSDTNTDETPAPPAPPKTVQNFIEELALLGSKIKKDTGMPWDSIIKLVDVSLGYALARDQVNQSNIPFPPQEG